MAITFVDYIIPDDVLQLVLLVGALRQANALINNREHSQGEPVYGGWTRHIEACAGEYTVAQHFELCWRPHIGNIYARDVGPLEVRTTQDHGNRLWIFPKDRAAPFVLVTGIAPNMRINGWFFSAEAKQENMLIRLSPNGAKC
jgi:hypothetical protein